MAPGHRPDNEESSRGTGLAIAPRVSVRVLAYNHARFIRQALDGVLMQEASFPFEICIGEDDSSDGTREICREYAALNPEKIRLFLRSRRDVIRIGGRPTGRHNFIETLNECRGEYVALLDGDDYWTSPVKLQMQVDYLDAHPEIAVCGHAVVAVDSEGSPHPTLAWDGPRKTVTTTADLLQRNFLPTCSVVFRRGLIGEFPDWFRRIPMADWPLHILNSRHGDVGFLGEPMAAHRFHTRGYWSGVSRLARFDAEAQMLRCLRGELPASFAPMLEGRIRDVELSRRWLLDRPEARPSVEPAERASAAATTPTGAAARGLDRDKVGYELLGPIFLEFCARLHRALGESRSQAAGAESVVLFLARAGLRLRLLYETYFGARAEGSPLPLRDVYISRLSCARACLGAGDPFAAATIVDFYAERPRAALLEALRVPDDPMFVRSADRQAEVASLLRLAAQSAPARAVLAEQHELLTRYLDEALGGAQRAIVVDSGWTGATQAMLTRVYPDVRWTGCYFGVWAFRRPLPPEAHSMTGLAVDQRRHSSSNPRSAITRHYHLVESALETRTPSVASYVRSESAELVEPDSGHAAREEILPGPADEHFAGILEYVGDHARDSPDAVSSLADGAWRRLARHLWFPTRDVLAAFLVEDRSIDFGSIDSNPVLRGQGEGPRGLRGFRWRFSRSLWKEGQLALECPRLAARALQVGLLARRRLLRDALAIPRFRL
jgi:hypothetical protein